MWPSSQACGHPTARAAGLLPPPLKLVPLPSPSRPSRYGAIVLAVEILGGLAMLPYGLCLVMRVTNNAVPPPDDKGQARWRQSLGWGLFLLPSCAGALLLLLPLTEPACRAQVNAPASASSSPACPSTAAPQVHTALNYHIRVVVPCYKEPLDVIQKTVTAALVAPIPTNCSRTGA